MSSMCAPWSPGGAYGALAACRFSDTSSRLCREWGSPSPFSPQMASPGVEALVSGKGQAITEALARLYIKISLLNGHCRENYSTSTQALPTPPAFTGALLSFVNYLAKVQTPSKHSTDSAVLFCQYPSVRVPLHQSYSGTAPAAHRVQHFSILLQDKIEITNNWFSILMEN